MYVCMCLSVYLSVYLSIYLSIYLSVVKCWYTWHWSKSVWGLHLWHHPYCMLYLITSLIVSFHLKAYSPDRCCSANIPWYLPPWSTTLFGWQVWPALPHLCHHPSVQDGTNVHVRSLPGNRTHTWNWLCPSPIEREWKYQCVWGGGGGGIKHCTRWDKCPCTISTR